MQKRGTFKNPKNRFESNNYEAGAFSDLTEIEPPNKTSYIPTFPKTIINKVTSDDLPMAYSLNPYQGCEHGCIYCYARPTHNYWGYSSGMDFEQKILVKKDVVKLLEKKISNKKWVAAPIALSGNTDCYQPAEAKYKLTRSILETLLKYRHPVSIITKNSLILRDLDLLKKLNDDKLISVYISITTLNKHLQSVMEPRTAIPMQRMRTLKVLRENGIPASVMMAPIIPGLTSHEIMDIARISSENGALGLGATIVRLNHDLGELFEDWLVKHFPDRKDKILNHIKEIRKGKLSATVYEDRMKGSGVIAQSIQDQLKLARKLYFSNVEKYSLNTKLHEKYKSNQLRLF